MAQCIQNSSSAAEDGNDIRLVLLGRTGTGKSATGNTILEQDDAFVSLPSASSVTGECQKESSVRFGHRIEVVDTPGIFDTSQTNKEVQSEIAKCIAMTSPGPHAFLLVLTIARFTEEEGDSIDHFIKYFGENIYDYSIILFTGKDNLDRHKKSLHDYLETSTPGLKLLIQKCGGRVIAFNNDLKKQESEKQVKTLFELITKNTKEHGNKHYTNVMYTEAERILKMEEEKMKQKAIEEQQRQVQEMEKKVKQQYDIKMTEKENELQYSKEQMHILKEKKTQDENTIKQLAEHIKNTEEKYKQSEGKEKEKLNNRLLEYRGKLAEKTVKLEQTEKEFEKMENDRKKKEHEIIDLKKQHEQEKESLKKKITEKFKQDFFSLRSQVIKLLSEDDSVMTLFAKAFYLMGENIRNFCCCDEKKPEQKEKCPNENTDSSIDTPVTTVNDTTPPNDANINKCCYCKDHCNRLLHEQLKSPAADDILPLFDKIASSLDDKNTQQL